MIYPFLPVSMLLVASSATASSAASSPARPSPMSLSAQLRFGFVGDYAPSPAARDSGVPAQVVYRRGAQVCLDVGWKPPAGRTAEFSVEATGDAVVRTPARVTYLPLLSERLQEFVPAPGRAAHLKLVFAALPDRVLRGRLEIPVRVRLGRQTVREGVALDLITVEARPFVPPVVDGLNVLDEAASYADGASGPEAVAAAVTEGLYEAGRFRYDDVHTVQAFGSAAGTVSLGLLRARGEPLPVNCYQVSGYLSCLLGALGVESALREIVLESDRTEAYHFTTAPVAPIGSPRKDATAYKPRAMFSHQFVLVDDKVYDATYAALRGPNDQPWRRAIAGWPLSRYLGVPAGQHGGFLAGVDAEGRRRAFVRVEYGQVPCLWESGRADVQDR